MADDIRRAAAAAYEMAAAGDRRANSPTPRPDGLTLARLVLEYFGDDVDARLASDVKLIDVARAILEAHGGAGEPGGVR
jgi:hypothetical protein